MVLSKSKPRVGFELVHRYRRPLKYICSHKILELFPSKIFQLQRKYHLIPKKNNIFCLHLSRKLMNLLALNISNSDIWHFHKCVWSQANECICKSFVRYRCSYSWTYTSGDILQAEPDAIKFTFFSILHAEPTIFLCIDFDSP